MAVPFALASCLIEGESGMSVVLGSDFKATTSASTSHSCNCIGPRNGEPYCPCRMRGVIERNGRWIQPERDLGPVARRGSFPTNKDT